MVDEQPPEHRPESGGSEPSEPESPGPESGSQSAPGPRPASGRPAGESSGLPRPVLAVALALSGLLAFGVIGLGLYSRISEHQRQQEVEAAQAARRIGPLPLPPIPSPGAGSPECAGLLAKLPQQLTIYDAPVPRRPLADPAPAGAVAWGDAGHDPVTVRCGLPDPAELTPTAQLVEVSGVSWLRLAEAGSASWVAVDRPVNVALTAPEDAGTAPVQDLSTLIRANLPRVPVFP